MAKIGIFKFGSTLSNGLQNFRAIQELTAHNKPKFSALFHSHAPLNTKIPRQPAQQQGQPWQIFNDVLAYYITLRSSWHFFLRGIALERKNTTRQARA